MGKKKNGQKQQDLQARKEGPDKLHFSEKDLINVYPITHAQQDAFNSYYQEKNVALLGSAGTGKTFIAMYMGLRDVFLNHYRNLTIVRSATPGKDLGHLPGTLEEKLQVFEQPYMGICDDLLPRHRNNYENMKRRGYVSFVSTSYLRGQTFDNTIVLVDELQNLTMNELHAIMTRIGEESRVILCGDIAQTDLERKRRAPWAKLIHALETIPSFETVYFNRHDIVRSDFVKEWIIAAEDLELLEST